MAIIVTPLWLHKVSGAHAGIALATGLAGLINPWLLWRALRRQGVYRASAGWAWHLTRLLLACVAMAAVLLWLARGGGVWGEMHGLARGGLVLLIDRKRVVEGKGVSVRVDIWGRRYKKKKTNQNK